MATATKKPKKPGRKPAKRPPTRKPGPKPVKPPDADVGARNRASSSARHAATSRAGRDIWPIPDIADVERRERCRDSLRLFFETYNPEPLYFPWAPYHVEGMDRLEESAINDGSLDVWAWPRGGAKTIICRVAALWAVSNSHRRYAFLLGANSNKAEDNLAAIKTFIRFLPLFVADYPDIAHAAIRLRGIPNRAGGQICNGEENSTMIEWSKERIILPTVPPPSNWPAHWPLRSDGMVPTSGSVIGTSGLTGDGIRGSALTLSNGELLRPDWVLLDDVQTDESAASPSQNATREGLVDGAVLGMAGPGMTISAAMICTVIRPGDMSSNFLDRKKHPLWRSSRVSMLSAMPSSLKAWEPYFELFRAGSQLEPPDYSAANAYYLEHRAELDAGAEATWPERKIEDRGEVSGIQSAMNLYCLVGPHKFASEYQNDPLPEVADVPGLEPDSIAGKVNRLERGVVPLGATHLTAFIDVQQDLLYWLVLAVDDSFSGAVIDYGAYPDQQRPYFQLRDANPTLSSVAPGAGLEGALWAGLTALIGQLLNREWKREDGSPMKAERAAIDAGEGRNTDTIYTFCRRSPHAAILMPSHGRGIGAKHAPMGMYKPRTGETVRDNWSIKPSLTKGIRFLTADVNTWKSAAQDRLRAAQADKGSISLYGDDPEQHRMFADHATSETAHVMTDKTTGRTAVEWVLKPNRENHLLDCFVGALVLASVGGASMLQREPPTASKRTAADYARAVAEHKRRRA